MRKLLVFLLVLGVVIVAGDRIAAKLATDKAEQRLAAHGLQSPSVDVSGFPFVTQLLSRHFDDIRVSTPSLQARDGQAEDVSATGHDVRVPSNDQVVVGHLDAHGTISYAEVLSQVGQRGLRLSSSSPGEVQLRRDVTVLGRTVAVTARGKVEASGTRLRVVPTSVRVAGGADVGDQLSAAVADQLSFSYRVRGLPDGLEISRITPGPNGFVVEVTGDDVTLDDQT